MITWTKGHLYRLLRWSEKYAKTDMLYVAASSVWINIGRIVAIASGMVLTTAFANLLSPESFGMYKYVLAAAGVVGGLGLVGLGGAVTRAVAQKKGHVVPGVVRLTMLWSLPASIITAGVGVYYFTQDNTLLGWGFLFISVFNVLSNGWGLAKSILAGLAEFKRSLIVTIPRTLFPVIVIVTTLFFTQDIVWILAAYFSSNALASWALYRWCLRRMNVSPEATRSPELTETIRLGTHLSALSFFITLSSQIDQLLVFHFSGATHLAIYALALAPVQEARTFLDNSITLIFPRFASKDKDEARRSVALRAKQMFLISALVTIAYIALIPYLFQFLFPKYLPAVTVSQFLALSLLFQPRGVIDAYLLAHGEIKRRYVWVFLSQALSFGLDCILIPFFGLWGAVAAQVLAEAGAAGSIYFAYRMR